jgi:hypothetical protein
MWFLYVVPPMFAWFWFTFSSMPHEPIHGLFTRISCITCAISAFIVIAQSVFGIMQGEPLPPRVGGLVYLPLFFLPILISDFVAFFRQKVELTRLIDAILIAGATGLIFIANLTWLFGITQQNAYFTVASVCTVFGSILLLYNLRVGIES